MPNWGELGRYQLLERIGMGGMAEVYQAKLHGAQGFEKNVAVKMLLPHLANGKELRHNLAKEAGIVVQLQHPNIVQVFELQEEPDTMYMVMEWIDGINLRQLQHAYQECKQTIPIELSCHILIETLKALGYAHHLQGRDFKGVLHRDISPQNILIGYNGQVKLSDFGIAKLLNAPNESTTGHLKGKYGYMSPEQAQRYQLDERSDLFSLGAVAYELLCEERLFHGRDAMEVLKAVSQCNITPIKVHNPQIPDDLQSWLGKLLAKNPEQRFASAHDALHMLIDICHRHCWNLGLNDIRKILIPLRDHVPHHSKHKRQHNTLPLHTVSHWRHTKQQYWLGALALVAIGATWWLMGSQAPPPQTKPAIIAPAQPAIETAIKAIPKARGRLSINALPWAYVRVDGKRYETPLLNLKLTVGQYQLEVYNPALKKQRRYTIEIKADQLTKKLVDFR